VLDDGVVNGKGEIARDGEDVIYPDVLEPPEHVLYYRLWHFLVSLRESPALGPISRKVSRARVVSPPAEGESPPSRSDRAVIAGIRRLLHG
jgi:hypothetical protein